MSYFMNESLRYEALTLIMQVTPTIQAVAQGISHCYVQCFIEVPSPLTLGGSGDCGYCSNNTVLPPDSNDGVLRVLVTWEVAIHTGIEGPNSFRSSRE